MTDGEIYDSWPLANHAHVTLHLPSLFVMFHYSSNMRGILLAGTMCQSSWHIMPQMSAVLILDNLNAMGHLIMVKGNWENHLPQPPSLTDDLLVVQCPMVTMEHFVHG